jgi:hypothetical protein
MFLGERNTFQYVLGRKRTDFNETRKDQKAVPWLKEKNCTRWRTEKLNPRALLNTPLEASVPATKH